MNQLKKEKLNQKWLKVMDFQFLKEKEKKTERQKKRTGKKASEIC